MAGLPDGEKNFEDMCNRLGTIPARDRQTDRQTDILPRHSPRYAYASRGKSRRFHVPQPTFLFSVETPLRLSRNMLHGWKENSTLTNCLAECVYLTITVSQIERDIGRKSSFLYPPCIRRPR